MLFWICLSGPLLFLFNSFIIASITSDYSLQHNTISLLVHGDHGKWQTINFIVCGVLTLGLAYLLKDLTSTTYRNINLIKLGAVTLGLSLILLGLFPTDQPGQSTLVGQIHGAIFVITVLIQAGLQLAFALSNFPSGISTYLLVSGLITSLGLPGMQLFPDGRGIIQRVFVGAIMLWVTLGALIFRK